LSEALLRSAIWGPGPRGRRFEATAGLSKEDEVFDVLRGDVAVFLAARRRFVWVFGQNPG